VGLDRREISNAFGRREVIGTVAQEVVLPLPPGRRVGGRGRVAEPLHDLAGAVEERVGALRQGRKTEVRREGRENQDEDDNGDGGADQGPGAAGRERALFSRRRDHLGRRRLSRRQSRRERIAAGKGRGDLRHRGGAPRGILLDTAEDHALDDRIEPGGNRRGKDRGFLRVLALQLLKARSVEGLSSGVQLVEDESERVDVAADRCALAGELLGRHVGRRAGDLPLDDLARGDREAEVGDARTASSVDHDV
jgi:hypothetical protein